MPASFAPKEAGHASEGWALMNSGGLFAAERACETLCQRYLPAKLRGGATEPDTPGRHPKMGRHAGLRGGDTFARMGGLKAPGGANPGRTVPHSQATTTARRRIPFIAASARNLV